MVAPKHLYSEIPPTKIRNREEKFRKAKDNPFWIFVGNRIFYSMLKNRFYSLMYKGLENFEKRDKNLATIFYAPHSNWWDGLIGYVTIHFLLRKTGKFRMRLMIEEMNRFPLFQYVGCFPINKKSPQSAMQSLSYAANTLKDNDIAFWLFPQGIIRPPHYRPEIFQSGLAYMAKNAAKKFGGVNLIPVAVNYTFLRQDRPEVLLEFGEPKIIKDPNFDRKDFTHKLEREFEDFTDKQQSDISRGDFEGYQYLYKEKLHWWRYIESKLKSIGIKNKED